MASLKTILRHRALFPRLAYAGTVLFFLWLVASFHVPGKGFTAFVMFGDKPAENYLPELKALDVYYEEDSHGYDAQHYAQIAIRPDVRDPELKTAVDNISYRARRILFSWTAWAVGGGDPGRVLAAFALQNVVCWLALAALLLRWFPANGWGNYLRWASILFSYGVWFSVRGALVDGPSLLMIAGGVALAEAGRPWSSALVLGLAGLGKETNILAGGALLGGRRTTFKGWLAVAARGVVMVLPLVLWGALLWSWFGGAGGTGSRNFSLPFVGYIQKWREILTAQAAGDPLAYTGALWMVTATTQFVFLAVRPRWESLWWRVGAAFAVLMMFLGDAVWEGHPGAAGRVLLPMALAFNILVPRGPRWFAVLLLGNLTIFGVSENMNLPGRQSFEVHGIDRGGSDAVPANRVEVLFPTGWHGPERSRWEYWRWSSGSADVVIVNRHDRALLADVTFGLRSRTPRTVTVRSGEQVLWTGETSNETKTVVLAGVRLDPGETRWHFETPQEALPPGTRDRRPLAFSLRDLKIEILGPAE